MGKSAFPKGLLVFPYRLTLIFTLFSFLVIITGYNLLKNEEKRDLQVKKNALTAIADFKVNQISNWRFERMSNAREIYRVPILAKYLKNCIESTAGACFYDIAYKIISKSRHEDEPETASVQMQVSG